MRLARIENQFRMTVRDYALHTLFAIVFENPKSMYERPQPIAGQMPNCRR